MRTVRAPLASVGVPLGVAAAGLLIMFGPAEPARAATVAVEVTPSTTSGSVSGHVTLHITAHCPTHQSATATSDLPGFAKTTLLPGERGANGTGSVRSDTPPGKYTVTAVCDNANRDSGTAVVWVVKRGTPSQGPHTGDGGMAGSSSGTGDGPAAAVPVLIGGLATVITGLGLLMHRRRPRLV